MLLVEFAMILDIKHQIYKNDQKIQIVFYGYFSYGRRDPLILSSEVLDIVLNTFI